MTVELLVQFMMLAGLGLLTIFARIGMEQAARRGVDEWFESKRWRDQLGRELERLRGAERQQLRFQSYGGLWSRTRPIAAFSGERFDHTAAETLREQLAIWYYSTTGGLLLTTEARSAYVALQTLLDGLVRIGEWDAERPPGDLEEIFAQVCARAGVQDVRVKLDTTKPGDWPGTIGSELVTWRDSMDRFVEVWQQLSPTERFAALHQVASRLRTVLTRDVDSRLR